MADYPQARSGALTTMRNPAFTLAALRELSRDSAMMPVCSDYAKVYYPRTALARAA